MLKVPVKFRLDPELHEWAEGYARSRGWTLTMCVESALAELRDAAAGGVPEPWSNRTAQGLAEIAQDFAQNAQEVEEGHV